MGLTKSSLEKLYLSGKSMMEISKILKCSQNKIVYWMKKYDIKRRTTSEAIYKMHNPNGDPFKIKRDLSPEDYLLKGLGLGIYWGEGSKKTKYSLRVANTDPELLKVFIRFLEQICNLEKHRFSYSLICFNDIDPKIARNYWAGQLKISPEKFGKITIIPKQGKGTYKKKSQFGVCTVNANNTKLRNWLVAETERLKENKPN